MTFDLDARSGWPEELRLFLDRYPREAWFEHVNLGDTARFWLDIHGGFRALGGAVQAKATALREGSVTPEEFRLWLPPRLQMLLTHLHGHHHIEDAHFFPLFASAEPRLSRGFDVLERDHEAIHETIVEVVESARAFLRAPAGDVDAVRAAADGTIATAEALLRRLNRHLDDEEDLIVPLILDRGESELGL